MDHSAFFLPQILPFLTLCSANLLGEFSIPSIDLSLPDINEVKSAFQSLQPGVKLFDDISTTEVKFIQEAFNKAKSNEDVNLNITQLIKKYGFAVEEHEVTTEDGYILTMYRIPSSGDPVFVMHGLYSSSDDFVTAGRDRALAYHLASEGYDVWLGNARGNKHSRKHETKSPDSADFWEFSWHEIGVYDQPAMIDYVIKKTGRSSLAFVGYSQGTTSFFVMSSERPEYNKKIKFMAALAPIAYVSHMTSPLFRLLALNDGIEYWLLKSIGMNELSPNNALTRAVASVLCGDNPAAKILCSNFVAVQFGFGRGELNVTNLPVVYSHFPSGGSSKQAIHYAQLIKSKRFSQFDYGTKKNNEVYGSDKPSDYKIENIDVPVALLYSDKDWLASVTDVVQLKDELPNVEEYHLVKDYGHLDFAFAKTIKEKVYEPLVSYLRKYYY